MIIVLVFGTVIGLFVFKTAFDPVPPRYALPFRQAQWVVAEGEGPQGYFRRELYIADTVQRAWIMISATNSFALHLNGETVGEEGPELGTVSGVYDIGRFLHPGKNVIGVQVQRATYPGQARMVCEGAYFDQSGKERPIFTESSWKASPREEMQGRGTIPWKEIGFTDQAWSPVRTAGVPAYSEIKPVDLPPEVIISGPKGKWIAPSNPSGRMALFEQSFYVPQKPRQAWLRVTADDSYDLTVNGILLANQEFPRQAFDIYSLGSLLRKGANTIQARASVHLSAQPRLLLDGLILERGEVKTILATDSSWLTASSPSEQRQKAMSLADYNPGRDGPLVKNPIRTEQSITLMVKKGLGMLACVFSTLFIVALAWGLSSRLLRKLAGASSPHDFFIEDGLLHLPPILFLGVLYLMAFDDRFGPGFPFQEIFIGAAIGFPLLGRLALFAEVLLGKRCSGDHTARVRPPFSTRLKRFKPLFMILIMISVLMAGLSLRVHNVQTSSLTHDEAGMALFAREVLSSGAPFKTIGTIEKPLTTYELIPYPIALSIALFGSGDFPVRLPALVWAAATMILIFYVGRKLWNDWTGVLAAAIHAFSSYAIVWGSNAFHPQQTQFFALLTAFLFYESIEAPCGPANGIFSSLRSNPPPVGWVPISASLQQAQGIFDLKRIFSLFWTRSHSPQEAAVNASADSVQGNGAQALRPAYLYGAAASFIVTYLSWEGSGLLLPAFFLCLLAARAGDAAIWFRSRHLWIATGIISLAVMVQLGRRILLNYPYIVVGKGLSGATFSLAFTEPFYTPWFYLQNFLFSGDHLLLSLLVLLGLPFLVKDRSARYFCILLWLLLTFLTNLMPNVSLRYVYFLLPFLILPASAIVLHVVSSVWQLPGERSWVVAAGKIVSSFLFIVMVLAATNGEILQLTRLGFSDGLNAETNPNVSGVDYRSTHLFLEKKILPGDAVISLMPQTLEYYAGRRNDYYIQAYTSRQVFYDVGTYANWYLDKYSGSPVIRNLTELQDVLNRYKRVWIVVAPYGAFLRTNDDPIIDYISLNARVAFESYKTRIFLWKG